LHEAGVREKIVEAVDALTRRKDEDLKDNLNSVLESASGSEHEAKARKYRQALKLIGAQAGSFSSTDMYISDGTQQTEDLQKPYHHRDHDHGIEDALYLRVHGNVGIDQPEQYADHDKNENKMEEGHDKILQ
jgi:hypothetical protein